MNKYTLASHCYGTILGHDVVLLDLAQCQKERQYVLLKNGASVVSTILAESGSELDTPGIEQDIEAMSNAGWLVTTSDPAEPTRLVSTIPNPNRIRGPFWLPCGSAPFVAPHRWSSPGKCLCASHFRACFFAHAQKQYR